MRTLVTAALVVLTTTASQAKTKKEWRQFISPDGRFGAMFPGTANERDQPLTGEGGTLIQKIAETEDRDEGAYYAVGYMDYPRELALAATDKILDAERDHALASVHGRLVAETKITENGFPGRELTIDTATPNTVALLRIYMVNQRRYQVLIVLPANQEPEHQFFESFRFAP